MLHAAGFLMSWLTGKRAHSLSISVSFLSFKAKSFACSSLQSLFYCVGYMKMSILFLYFFFFLHFFAPHFGSGTPTFLCCAVTQLLFLPLFFRFCFLLPLSLFVSSSPLFLHFFSSLLLYFVQCHRVLLVPRALLTLSLLPLTVWWDLTVR